MYISHKWISFIKFLIEQCIPPYFRDQKWFMYLPLKLYFRKQLPLSWSFKERSFDIGALEYRELYRTLASDLGLKRKTDLNPGCIQAILKEIGTGPVLEVGCGQGFLTTIMGTKNNVLAVDIFIDPTLRESNPNVQFLEMQAEQLPFPDQSFENVVCAHTLEHVQDLAASVAQLRRVASKQLIIVLPRERHYRYSFNLHLHFFPYSYSVFGQLGPTKNRRSLRLIEGDWFYQEWLKE